MQINPATKGVEKNNADGFAMDTNKWLTFAAIIIMIHSHIKNIIR